MISAYLSKNVEIIRLLQQDKRIWESLATNSLVLALTNNGTQFDADMLVKAISNKKMKSILVQRNFGKFAALSNAPLCWAAENGYVDVVRWLLEEGVGSPTVSNFYPLNKALENGDVEIARLLLNTLELQALIANNKLVLDCSLLRKAVLSGNVKVVELLLEVMQHSNPKDNAVIYMAIARGSNERVLTNSGKYSDLSSYLAASMGNLEVVKLGLQKYGQEDNSGISRICKREQRHILLRYATKYGQWGIVRFLLSTGGTELQVDSCLIGTDVVHSSFLFRICVDDYPETIKNQQPFWYPTSDIISSNTTIMQKCSAMVALLHCIGEDGVRFALSACPPDIEKKSFQLFEIEKRWIAGGDKVSEIPRLLEAMMVPAVREVRMVRKCPFSLFDERLPRELSINILSFLLPTREDVVLVFGALSFHHQPKNTASPAVLVERLVLQQIEGRQQRNKPNITMAVE